MYEGRPTVDELPSWVLAVVPALVLAAVVGVLWATSPFGDLESLSGATTVEMLWMLAVVGAIAGIVPVAIGMLWFPYIRSLDPRVLHAFFALAAGVLAFVAIDMTEGVIAYGRSASSTSVAALVAIVGVSGTFAAMYLLAEWRGRAMAAGDRSGLQVAYLVATALGLHSIGEGLAIGSAFVLGEFELVTLLVVGFVMHNVTEGPTVVAAVARDAEVPPLRHFAAMGAIAGGPVILGGWIGSLAYVPLLAVLFFAVALGAIAQVIVEMVKLIRFDAGAVLTRVNAATFVVGLAIMYVLEEVVVGGWIGV